MIAIRNTETSWGIVSRVLHCLIAIGIFVLLWLGLDQSGMPRGDERTAARGVHAGWALIVLALMTTRIIWRLMNTVPHHPAGVPSWQRASALIVQMWAGGGQRASVVQGLSKIATVLVPGVLFSLDRTSALFSSTRRLPPIRLPFRHELGGQLG